MSVTVNHTAQSIEQDEQAIWGTNAETPEGAIKSTHPQSASTRGVCTQANDKTKKVKPTSLSAKSAVGLFFCQRGESRKPRSRPRTSDRTRTWEQRSN